MSSVLNRDTKQFGKKFMFDDDEETCWNSDQVETEGMNDLSGVYCSRSIETVHTLMPFITAITLME